MQKNPTHTIREHRHCEGNELHDYELVPFESAWRARVLREEMTKAADRKARDFAVFYFDTVPHQRNMKHIAGCYGIERETAANYMLRMHTLGFLEAMPSPELAREATMTRVYLRKVYWSEDFWNDAGSF